MIGRPWLRPAAFAVGAAGLAALAGFVAVRLPTADGAAVVVALAALAVAALLAAAWSAGALAAADPLARLFKAAAEADFEAQLVTDADGAVVYANAAFRRLMAGDGDGAVATVREAAQRLGGGSEAARALDRLAAAAAAGVAGHAEVAFETPSGTSEWRRFSVIPAPGWHALWRAEDVTARREMDSVRHRQEEVLADLLDHLPVGFFSADASGRILYANHTLTGWLGVGAEEIREPGIRFADFVVSGDGETDGGEELGAGGAHGRVFLRGAGGATFAAFLMQSEQLGPIGDFAYSRSVVLRASELPADDAADAGRRLRWLFAEAPVGIALLNLDGEVVEANRALLKLLGLHREAVEGRALAERIDAEDLGDVAAQLSKVVMGTIPAAHLDVRMPGAGRRQLVISLFASRMKDADGEVSGLILHFIDTTEHKELEVQFAQAQKMQAMGQLAGGVAHDFNNLLTAMIGFCDLLLERHGPDDPSFADIMQIRQNTQRATNLVRQLLAFSRKQTLEPVRLDPTAALSDVSTLLRRLIGENIELVMEHGRDLGVIRVDPGQFDQVIVNLAVNARDAMPGGGTLTIRTSNARVDTPLERGLELMPEGAYVLVEVIDTGAGIAKDSIGRIFEPFFSTKDKGAGTGLGLSTVYGIVRQTDGFIFVDSARGAGTTFSIYLPRYEASAEAEDAPVAAAPGRFAAPAAADLTGAGTVLFVEDEDSVRHFGVRALRNKGYQVLEADDGEAALDVINSPGTAIDLIISDVVLPGMDGHLLVQLVRQELTDVKVILMSGYAEDVVPGQLEHEPTIHFLAKPFSLKDLTRTVKEVMEA